MDKASYRDARTNLKIIRKIIRRRSRNRACLVRNDCCSPFPLDLTNRKLRIWSRDLLDQSYGRNLDFEPSIRKVPLLLNSVNIDGMIVKFLQKNDVDHQISSETFVYRPNRPFLFPLNVHTKLSVNMGTWG